MWTLLTFATDCLSIVSDSLNRRGTHANIRKPSLYDNTPYCWGKYCWPES
jgi:hypothetical protein